MIGTVTLLVVAGLAADTPGPIEVGRQAAVARWGEIPCDVTVKRQHLPGWVAGEARYSTDGDARWDCEVVIDVDQLASRQERCAVAMHEFGHLHGLGHSSDPRDVMHSPLQVIPRRCERAFRA
jgi:hypothetical protein